MKTKITMEDVKYDPNPYYISCAFCNKTIKGKSPEDVVETAEREGWGIQERLGKALCPHHYELYWEYKFYGR